MDKIISSIEAIVKTIPDGAHIAVGGFGLSGMPEYCIRALENEQTKNLTIYSNNCGIDGEGLGRLLAHKQIQKMVASYVGENKALERQYLTGEIELELVPQGTLAEKLRLGGSGIPAFFTEAGVGTPIAEGKEMRTFGEKTYLLETTIEADYAFVKGWKADRYGNVVYRGTAQNFNPLCAMAGRITIVEVEEIVEVGTLNPRDIHTPAAFVQYVYEGENYDKKIEKRVVREGGI